MMTDNNIRIKSIQTNKVHISLGEISYESGNGKVYSDTTGHWNSQKDLIGRRGIIYIYTDYSKDQNGNPVPAAKVGDGNAYLIDTPFISSDSKVLNEHLSNNQIHITQKEREFWNNKVTAYISADPDEERLVLTKN